MFLPEENCEMNAFNGFEGLRRNAGIIPLQLSSQSDCTWREGHPSSKQKAQDFTTNHNRHCKTQHGQLFLFFASFKTTTLCVQGRLCSF